MGGSLPSSCPCAYSFGSYFVPFVRLNSCSFDRIALSGDFVTARAGSQKSRSVDRRHCLSGQKNHLAFKKLVTHLPFFNEQIAKPYMILLRRKNKAHVFSDNKALVSYARSHKCRTPDLPSVRPLLLFSPSAAATNIRFLCPLARFSRNGKAPFDSSCPCSLYGRRPHFPPAKKGSSLGGGWRNSRIPPSFPSPSTVYSTWHISGILAVLLSRPPRPPASLCSSIISVQGPSLLSSLPEFPFPFFLLLIPFPPFPSFLTFN